MDLQDNAQENRGRWYWPDVKNDKGVRAALLSGSIAASWLCLSGLHYLYYAVVRVHGINSESMFSIVAIASGVVASGFLAYRVLKRFCIISAVIVLSINAIELAAKVQSYDGKVYHVALAIALTLLAISGVRGTFAIKNKKQASA